MLDKLDGLEEIDCDKDISSDEELVKRLEERAKKIKEKINKAKARINEKKQKERDKRLDKVGNLMERTGIFAEDEEVLSGAFLEIRESIQQNTEVVQRWKEKGGALLGDLRRKKKNGD